MSVMTMEARDLLADLRSKDVRVWVEDSRLRLDAPKGLLTESVTQTLRHHKDALIALLEQEAEGPDTADLRRVQTHGPRPLSFAQERLFFSHRLVSEPIYNLGGAQRLHGALDITALQRALHEIVSRHEVLRTTFADGPDGPVQQVQPLADELLVREDLRDLDPAAQGPAVDEILQREALRPFDLSTGPLLRARLLQLRAREFVLLLTMHHIVSDAWSVGIFQRELAQLYADFQAGRGNGLPALEIQYADFAAWQRSLQASGQLDAQSAYWRARLRGSTPLSLPLDRPRPKAPTFRAGRLPLEVGDALSNDVAALSRACAATPFMTLLAALSVTLSVYTGQRDVAVASPIANRHRRRLEPLIGFFVNTQILRLDLRDQPTFRQLVARARQTCVEAYAHQDLPFDHLVEELQPQRAAGENPFAQVIFAFQNVPAGKESLAGLDIEALDFETGRLRLDLEIYLSEKPHGFAGHVLFNRDVFEPLTIERLLRLYRHHLAVLVARPDAPAFGRHLLPAEDAACLLGPWRGDLRPASEDTSIIQRFERIAVQHREATALAIGDQSLTYGQLERRANRLAHHLMAIGVLPEEDGVPEEVVAVLCERSFDLIVSLLAILKAGSCYVSLEADAPAARQRLVAVDAGVRRVITHGALRESAEQLGLQIIDLDADAEVLAQHPSTPPRTAALTVDRLAYIAYTSGSTGKPKGAAIPHDAVLRLIDEPSYLDIEPTDVFLQMAPVAFDASTLEIWGSLLNGAQLALMPPGPVSLEDLAQAIRRYEVSVLWLTAGLFHLMVEHQLAALATVPQLLAGGDVLAVASCQRWLATAPPGARLINGYGPTENTTFTCCHALLAADKSSEDKSSEDKSSVGKLSGDKSSGGEPSGDDLGPSIPIGRPISGTEIFILDDRMQPLPPGAIGSLYTGGRGLARGYRDRPALTATCFVPHPLAERPGARLYRTGDRARFLADGVVQFLGRADHQVKIRGFRVEPGEVAAVMRTLPGLRQCTVIARRDEEQARLDAYVVLDPAFVETTATDAATTGAATSHVERWRSLYNHTYTRGRDDEPTEPSHALDFEIVGWNSSYSGRPIADQEMAEWVAATVQRIGDLGPSQLLEIGCGTGLLLARLAPMIEHYAGVDFSPGALAHARRLIAARGFDHATLALGTADALPLVPAPTFDTVVINSVTQYFPDTDYLLNVLASAVERVKDGGNVFIGDVRNLDLLPAFHASVALHQAAPGTSLEDLWSRIQRAITTEEELLISPRLFLSLHHLLPRVTHVRLMPKQGAAHNELTRFRYDVVLEIGSTTAPRQDIRWLPDPAPGRALAQLRAAWDGRRPIAVRGLVNARLADEHHFFAALPELRRQSQATVVDVRKHLTAVDAQAVDPQDLWHLADELSARLQLSLGLGHSAGGWETFDAVLWPVDDSTAPSPRWPFFDTSFFDTAARPTSWSAWVHEPMSAEQTQNRLSQLRAQLKERLPDAMVPSTLTALAALPLNANGKVDRSALPLPQPSEIEPAGRAPESETEQRLAAIWRDVLGIDGFGVDDDFFTLGGHSLMATRVASRIRNELGVETPLRKLFELPTLAALATFIDAGSQGEARGEDDDEEEGDL